MKVRKKICMFFGSLFLIILASILALALGGNNVLAYAETLPKFKLAYNYVSHYHLNDTVSLVKREDRVFSSTLKNTCSDTTDVNIYMYGSSISEMINGNTISLTSATLELESDFLFCEITVSDNVGTKLGEGEKVIFLDNLSEGIYYISANLIGEEWNPSVDAVAWYSVSISATFCIDTTAPTISGASVSMTGKYTKTAFTISASDNIGIENIYMKEPNSEDYLAVGTTITVPKGSKDGLYSFYAKDKAGNVSAEYYVYYDNTAPIGEIKDANGTTLNTDYTNQAFSYTASDSGSGIDYLQVKNPTQSLWMKYVSGSLIKTTAVNGKYTFRAVDKCGSISETKVVYLDTKAPTVTIYGDTNTVTNGNTIIASYIKFIPSDNLSGVKECYIKKENDISFSAYISGEELTEFGTYSFYCVDHVGNMSDIYTITLAEKHIHNFSSQIIAPTCTTCGYSIFTCISCGESFNDDEVQPLGHKYVESIISPTCTEEGYTQHLCSRCNNSYNDNVLQPIGHKFIKDTISSTCTEYGKTDYECQMCGYHYSDNNGIYPTGHNYTSIIISAPTCTTEGLRRSICEACGNTIDAVIPSNGHNYQIVDTSSANGITKRTYTCKECGETYSQELGDQYEEVANYVEYLFEQYSPYMWWVLLVSAGIWSIAIGIMIAIAQKNEDKEKAKKMLVNYVIGLVVIAVMVVACPYLIRGIAALIT